MTTTTEITTDNIDTITALDLREGAAAALHEGHRVTLHRLRGCDVRPDWQPSTVVELLICTDGFVAAAANGGAAWMRQSAVRGYDNQPATIAWWIFRSDAETGTAEENKTAREYGETWASTNFDALVDESSRELSEHASIVGPWNRHPSGFPACCDDVAERAARAEWARLVDAEREALAAEVSL